MPNRSTLFATNCDEQECHTIGQRASHAGVHAITHAKANKQFDNRRSKILSSEPSGGKSEATRAFQWCIACANQASSLLAAVQL